MKKILFAAMLTSLFNQINGENVMSKSNNNYGCQKYGSERLESINGNGAIILQGTQILGSVQVNGSLRAEDASMNCLEVNGGGPAYKLFYSLFNTH